MKDDIAGTEALEEQLFDTARDGNLDKARALLEKGADVTATNVFGETPLHRAAFHGRFELVRELLKQDNVNVNAIDNDGSRVLIVAVLEGHLEVVIELLKHDKLDVNGEDTKKGENSTYLGEHAGSFGHCLRVVEAQRCGCKLPRR